MRSVTLQNKDRRQEYRQAAGSRRGAVTCGLAIGGRERMEANRYGYQCRKSNTDIRGTIRVVLNILKN